MVLGEMAPRSINKLDPRKMYPIKCHPELFRFHYGSTHISFNTLFLSQLSCSVDVLFIQVQSVHFTGLLGVTNFYHARSFAV